MPEAIVISRMPGSRVVHVAAAAGPGPDVDRAAEDVDEQQHERDRVHRDLLLSEDGRRTAADLTRRLKVSPASISVAVNMLVQQGYVRRERDPQRRRDIYVIDDDAWYHAIAISSRQTLESAQAATAAAETFGLDRPVGKRLAKVGAFLERVSLDMMESADRWRALLA
jgi:predicted transcriptional regulator